VLFRSDLGDQFRTRDVVVVAAAALGDRREEFLVVLSPKTERGDGDSAGFLLRDLANNGSEVLVSRGRLAIREEKSAVYVTCGGNGGYLACPKLNAAEKVSGVAYLKHIDVLLDELLVDDPAGWHYDFGRVREGETMERTSLGSSRSTT